MKIRTWNKNQIKNKKNLEFDESTYKLSSIESEEKFIQAQFKTKKELERYNQYRIEWDRRAIEMDPGSFPLAIICELVSLCNLNCTMCYTTTPEFQNSVIGTQRMMPWETVTKIIDECAELGVYSLLLSWRGESTLYKVKDSENNVRDIADVFEYARKKNILEITCLTNGRSIDKYLAKRIVKAQPNWISFSIDGIGEVYNKIRKSKKKTEANPFETVVANIKGINLLKKQYRSLLPQIRTNTIYPAISKDLDQYKSFMKSIGVDLLTVNEMLDFRGSEIPEDCIQDNWFCQYVFQRLVISANGTIMPCPGAHNEDSEIALGRYIGSPVKSVIQKDKQVTFDYSEMNIKQAWCSKKANTIRNLHSLNNRKEILTCKYCRHGAKKYGITWIPDDWDMRTMEWVNRVWKNN